MWWVQNAIENKRKNKRENNGVGAVQNAMEDKRKGKKFFLTQQDGRITTGECKGGKRKNT